MMIVKVKSKGFTFLIPVPYALLHMGSGILTSNLVKRSLKNWLNKRDGQTSEHPSLKHDFESDSSRFGVELVLAILESQSTRQVIRQLIKDLQCCKGTILVDVKEQDGTEVLVKL
ncbi:hypothetical protein [Paenibacillus sp. GCM10028914]|uniref:hypothetical protein n=1 Tax=Paenibacillus sp. GCM10028914 TaxID=3273416 RepID=UPI00361D60A8